MTGQDSGVMRSMPVTWQACI